MRVVWATCGLAVAASALTGVLVGFYLDDDPEGDADVPGSTWITERPSATGTSARTITVTTAVTTEAISAPRTTTSQPGTTTEPPPPQDPTTTVTTTVPATTTTTKVRRTEWPCGPLNPFPPPQCDE
ncbi:hypothetical protein GCM10022243_33550 [Saccharothrix violaceirubra]|uniref:Uncharacterized protein n=1 Tax=Saccharothrix violaceirubra TaxID=413306 RepID=A0A7W7WUF8_9PSEU|nr:hypothetical protein [Saccharothrix violaceirubra]MBB4964204.1 hypothetical protein [Saccharothrix violaceirubra]